MKQSDEVPNDALLEDIKNTKLEISAYKKLSDGYKILAALPENATDRFQYKTQHARYSELCHQCLEFLSMLMRIKKERGL